VSTPHNGGIVSVFVFAISRGQSDQQSWRFSATIDQSDIRRSKPHDLDPSIAAIDAVIGTDWGGTRKRRKRAH
jgi:hypothetical protein